MMNEKIEKLNKNHRVRLERLREKIRVFKDLYKNPYEFSKKELPFYDAARALSKNIKQTSGIDISVDEIFEECDFVFDKKCYEFNEFVKEVKKYEKDGLVSFPSGGVKNVTYTKLKDYAITFDCNPFDFLYLTTGMKLKDSYIQVDYISYLVEEIREAYPTGNITNIKRDRPDLYDKIRHLKRYLPEKMSSDEVVEFLGFKGERFYKKVKDKNISEDEVVDKLKQIYPDGKVVNLIKINSELYSDVVKLSLTDDKTVIQWLSSRGFEYPNGTNQLRLSKTKTDVEKRSTFLQKLKDEKMKDANLSALDSSAQFHYLFDITKEIITENDLKLGKETSKKKAEKRITLD